MRTFARPLVRHFLALSLFSAMPLACGGQLFLNADDAITDFEAIDRDGGDANGSDNDNGGDGDDGSGGDFSGGDNIIGDGFGPGDDGPEPCGFGGVCPSGQECIEGGCVAICNEARCGAARLCCANEGTRTECAFDRCQEPCPNSTDIRCGTEGQLCCDVGANQVCGTSLTCVQDCTGQGPLCGTGTVASFGSVCCNARGAGPDDDDVCVFNKCEARGQPCQSFLDCENGEYCELTLDPDPTTGYCLPNDFPPDAPVCQSPPGNLFSPITEWSWVGIQLVGSNAGDTDFSDNFTPGQIVARCSPSVTTNCYREPCTDLPTASGAQSANFKSQCFRSVETIPTTADMDKVDVDGSAAVQLVPEVVFKAYADNTFDNDNGNVIVIADGRADADLPASGIPSKQQRTKVVIYGETRGHMALGNLDSDPQLEIVAAHKNGICAYDPYAAGGAPRAAGTVARKWCSVDGSLNTRLSGGAPHLADFDGDGVVEIVMSGVIVRDGNPAPTVLVDLGTTNQAGESNGGARCSAAGDECFAISTVADVNLDGVPELLAGDKAWTIRRNPIGAAPPGRITGSGGWVADPLWVAHYRGGSTPQPLTIGNGRGFPGVGDFVDNTKPPYNDDAGVTKNTPEVVIVNAGAVYIVSGETGEVLQSPVSGSTINLAFQLLNNRGGPPNIADFDGDGRPEVSFAGTGCMVVVDPDCAAADATGRVNLANTAGSGCNIAVPGPGTRRCAIEVNAALAQEVGVLWQYQTQDQSSAVTGTSVFDFQGDGKAEVLYNDECFFRVFEGATSNILYERPDSHRTATEYPIVVDVDGDSNSEIVVVSTGDQSSKQSGDRDRCGGPVVSSPNCAANNGAGNQAACNAVGACLFRTSGNTCQPCSALNQTECGTANGCSWTGSACVINCVDASDDAHCNSIPGCHSLNANTCNAYSYRRGGWDKYTPSACTCADHTAQTDCDGARGCRWNGSTCVVVDASNSAGNCGSFGTRTLCQQHMDDCLWDDDQQGGTGACEENPRGQAYICNQATWGVTAFGDPEDKWVRTLPYWYEHPFHITNQDRDGTVISDWRACYGGSACSGQTDPVACEQTDADGGGAGSALCGFGEANTEFYNNFRQNVPGFVPLNAPDLRVETAVADLRTCPPTVKIIARVVNKGRAGISKTGVKVGFYRIPSELQTYQVTLATVTPFAAPELPVDLLPGGGVDIQVTYTIPSNEAPIDLDFRVIANPDFLQSNGGAVFECNGANNYADVPNLDCTGTGG